MSLYNSGRMSIGVGKFYTGIDIGSDSIKIVVSEFVDHKTNILAATSVRSVGVKKGLIVDPNMVMQSLKLALKEIEEMLGIKIKDAIVNVPIDEVEFTILGGTVAISDGEVTGEDVTNVLKDALLGQEKEDRELVTISPIGFRVDDSENVKDPKGLAGKELEVKAVTTTIPKRNLQQVLSIMQECNINVVDVTFGAVGDYAVIQNKDFDSKVGAIINVGSEKTEVSVFNKGIMIKNEIIPIGSKNVDRDLCYIYKIDQMTARKLKETFAVASKQYADHFDVIEIEGKDQEKLVINQSEISEFVESRLKEILNLAKKQINLLTKREISYIIITGGISELAGFQYVVENYLGRSAITLNMTVMGVRHNKYSSVLGMMKYFDQKLELRGKQYSMLEEEKVEELRSTKKKSNVSHDTVINKVFGHFFEN